MSEQYYFWLGAEGEQYALDESSDVVEYDEDEKQNGDTQ